MSLFGALLGDFDDDGFIGNPINSMNMQMRNMNRLMSSMMMPDPFNMLSPFDGGFNSNNSLMERGGGGGLFGMPAMPNMNRLLNADIGSNGASYCSSSVISMSSGPDGRPQIYQATSSTKTGPGGIRETRKTVQDSTTGVKKMAIGHHIGERAHIIEKEQNLRSGQHEERQEFINLDEEEAESFDREFTNKVRRHHSIVEITDGDHHSPRHRPHQRALPALPAPPVANSTSVHPHPYNNAAARRNFRSKHQKHHHHHHANSSQQHQHQQKRKESPIQPIVTLPDDDDDDDQQQQQQQRQQEESPNNEI